MDVTEIGSNFDYSTFMAERMQGGSHRPANLEEATQRLIQDKDEDGDGTLDAAEICISEELFKQVDANGDGKLNADELVTGAKAIGEELAAQDPQGPPPPPPIDLDEATSRLIEDMDDDGDGALSATEIPISETLFDQADTNHDGVLSADELKASAESIGKELFAQRMPRMGGKRAEDDETDDEEEQDSLLDLIEQNLDEASQSRLDLIL